MERVQTKLHNSEDKGVALRTIRTVQLKEQSFEKTERPWEQTQGEVDQVMGSQVGPKEKGTKEALGGTEQGTNPRKRTGGGLVWNKIRG